MATGTLSPDARLQFFDNNGLPLAGGKLLTYVAGTTTPQATYSDVGLTVANANPIILNASGRPSSAGVEIGVFLTPGASYKYVLQSSASVQIWTQDNISTVPGSSANLDITGTAGETLTAGQVVYLSDGSGGKNAGQWYKADNTLAYSSVLPQVGMVPAAITSGQSGTIRLGGQMTGLSSLTIGSDYYIGVAGALTVTAPKMARLLGRADSTSSLLIGLPSVPLVAWVNDFRLTLETGVPLSTTDQTAKTSLFCTPMTGNRIDLPDSNGNPVRATSAEFSIAVPATTSQMYDIFVFNNSGVAALELLAWTNDTTRATAVVRTTNGRLFKSGDNTRMYLGSFRTTTVSGQTEDSAAKRYLWNYYNRAARLLKAAAETADTWTYSTATWRQANANAANQLDVVIGIAEVLIDVRVLAVGNNSTAGVTFYAGVGEDSTSAPAAGLINDTGPSLSGGINARIPKQAWLSKYPAVGRHFYTWLEYSEATVTTTWYGDNGGVLSQSGIVGRIDG